LILSCRPIHRLLLVE